MSQKLTKSRIDKASSEKADYFLWDTELKGFGLKVSKGGRKTYVCKYRVGSGRTAPSRRMTIGAHGSPWTLDQARSEARKILGRAANGEDPAKEKQDEKKQITVAQLCDLYLEHGVGTKKQSTIATDKGRIERHIKPLLGSKRVPTVNRADIRRFLQDVAAGKTATDQKTGKFGRAIVRGGKGTATRTVGLLGGIFAYAEDAGLIELNPVRGIKRFKDKKGERFLSQVEMVALGQAMSDGLKQGQNRQAIAVLKLLMFTGARKGEIEALKWENVDLAAGYLRIEESKTGQKSIPLNTEALEILRELTRVSGSPFVFPALRGKGHYQGTTKVWRVIRERAGLSDVRMHDLRHSFASIAVSGGASLPIIGALLGHADNSTTQRYAHLHDDPVKAASEAVGSAIGKHIGDKKNTQLDGKNG
ncbi:tyrosine-type recombinase/integrase [Roseibium sp.]|uniref:tyrosine-type recombinase/integrase n=1 Tax=Roseibium sp. TaxID=1936156 RepID=UPI0039EE96D3